MFIKSTENKGTFTCDKDGKKLIKLIDDLWWGVLIDGIHLQNLP